MSSPQVAWDDEQVKQPSAQSIQWDDETQPAAKAAPSGPGYPRPIESGNIDWYNRPSVPMGLDKHGVGLHGTVFSASREQNGQEVLYPTVYDGAQHTDDEAWQHYKDTGEHMGKFRNAAEATQYAQRYHLDAAAGKFGYGPTVQPTLYGSPQDIASRALAQSGLPPAAPPATPRLRVNPNLPPENQGPSKYLTSGSTPLLQTEGEARQFDADQRQPQPTTGQVVKGVASNVLEGAPNDAGPAGSGFPLLQGVPNIARGTENLVAGDNREQRYEGGAQLISGTMDELLPAFTAGLIEKPIAVGGGLAVAYAAGKGARGAVKAAGGSPQAQDFAESAAFAVPAVLGLEAKDVPGERGAAVTGLGGKVAVGAQEAPGGGVAVGAKFGNTRVGKVFGGPEAEPEQPAIEPTTIKGEPGAVSKEAKVQWDDEKTTGTPEEIQKQAEAKQPETVKTAQDIAAQVPGARVVDPGAKPAESITRKSDSDRPVTDASRAQIVVPDEAAKQQATQKIAEQTPAHEIKPIEADSLPIVAAKLPERQEIQVATEAEHKAQAETHDDYAKIQEAKAQGNDEEAAKLQGQLDNNLAQRKYNDPNVEMVPLSELEKYLEFDRAKVASLRDPDHLAKLTEDVKQNGLNSRAFDEPLELTYDPTTKKATLGDGNHRFPAAKAAGIEALPVKVSTQAAWAMGKNGLDVPGHQGTPKTEYKPSEIGIGVKGESNASAVQPLQRGRTAPESAVLPEVSRPEDKEVASNSPNASHRENEVQLPSVQSNAGEAREAKADAVSELQGPKGSAASSGLQQPSSGGVAVQGVSSGSPQRQESPEGRGLAKGSSVTVDGKPGTLTYLSKQPFEKSRVKTASGEVQVPHREVARRIQPAIDAGSAEKLALNSSTTDLKKGTVQGITSGTPEQASPRPGAIAWDLDKSLAHYEDGSAAKDPTKIGAPIPENVALAKQQIADGKDVWVYSARAQDPKAVDAIKAWTKENVGKELPVTNVKHPEFGEFYDDRSKPLPVQQAESTSVNGGKEATAEPVKTQEKPYKYGSTQANIPHGSDASNAIIQARNRISDADLAGKGKDVGGEHVTVRYGIQGEDTAGVRSYIAGLAPFEAKLGKTSSFPPSTHSDGAAVIIAPIEAPELHKINAELEKHGDFTEPSFPEYKPHATIAYVKPEAVSRYTGMAVTEGKTFPVNEIAITNREGVQEVVSLKGGANEQRNGVEQDKSHAPESERTSAIREQSPTGLLQREQEETPEAGSGRGRVERGQQGEDGGQAGARPAEVQRGAEGNEGAPVKAEEVASPAKALKAKIAKTKKPFENNGWREGDTVIFTKTPPGSYLTADQAYTVEHVSRSKSKSGTVEFRNQKTGGKTGDTFKMLALSESHTVETAKREAPVERESLVTGESGSFTPKAVLDVVKAIDKAHDRLADAVLQKLHMGRAYPEVEKQDPRVARDLRELAAAPQYYRAKAENIVEKITGGMTREQEKGFVLLADKDSRDWLHDNKPQEYQSYIHDPRITQALQDYKPYEEDLRDKQKALGGPTIDEDYLRRVYAEHVAGVGKSVGKGEQKTVNANRVITPQMANKKGRIASAEYYYNNGLLEFGPSFATRYIATNLKLAEHKAAIDFLTKATKIENKDALPETIDYNGQTYYRPDVAKLIKQATANSPEGQEIAESLGVDQLPKPKDVREYSLYDPTPPDKSDYQAKKLAQKLEQAYQNASGTKFTDEDMDELMKQAASINHSNHAIYAGPREIVEAFQSGAQHAIPGWLRDIGDILNPVSGMVRRQVIGLGFGVPHIKNILRRVMQASPAAHLDPRSYARAAKVLFNKELRERGMKGVDDPAFDALLRHAGISDKGVESYRDYLKSNLDENAWSRGWAVLKAAGADSKAFHKQLLADIKAAHNEGGIKGNLRAGTTAAAGAIETPLRPLNFIGHHIIFSKGGIDQRARLWLYDLIKSQNPGASDDQIAQEINAQLGRYNRASWTDFQKDARPFTFFPGWDYSSFEWILRHPLRGVLPAALLVLLANQVLRRLGKNKKSDSTDLNRVHVGNYTISDNLFRERLASAQAGTALRFAKDELLGKHHEQSLRDSLIGVPSDARAFTGMLNPFAAAPLEVSFGKSLQTGQDIVPDKDKRKAGKPEKDWMWYVTHKVFPAYSEIAEPQEGETPATFALHNAGTSIYKGSRKRR